MTKKTWIILIAIISIIAIGVFALISFFPPSTQDDSLDLEKLKALIERKNSGVNLSESENKQIQSAVEKVKEQKLSEIEKKIPGEDVRYTQEELDFIANPEYETERSLGIRAKKPTPVIYTREELNYIADPTLFSKEDQERIRKQVEAKE